MPRKWLIAWDFTLWSFFACMAYSPILKLAMSDLGHKDANMGATLLNVSRLVFASIGISIAVAIETRRADTIYVSLASKVNYGSVLVRKFLAEKLNENPDMLVQIKGDKDTRYGDVAWILEELKKARAIKVSLASKEER